MDNKLHHGNLHHLIELQLPPYTHFFYEGGTRKGDEWGNSQKISDSRNIIVSSIAKD